MPRASRAFAPTSTLRMELPTGRRRPPPSRLPGMDLAESAPAGKRPRGLLQRLAKALFKR